MKEFDGIGSFIAHLATVETAVQLETERGLNKVAELIEKDAKHRIGEYQSAVGPFPAWSTLAPSTEEEKGRLGYSADSPLLRDGQLRDSIEHEVIGSEAVVGSKSDVAEYQEFGTRTIPPRPFIGPAAFNNKAAIEHTLGAALVVGLSGGTQLPAELGYGFDVGDSD